MLNDIGAERAVLACIMTLGETALLEIEEILSPQDFYGKHHHRLFQTLSHMVHNRGAKAFDVPSVLATARNIGHDELIGKGKDEDYLQSLQASGINLDNALTLATNVYKLSLMRSAYLVFAGVLGNLKKVKGTESLEDLMGMIEDPVLSFTAKLVGNTNELMHIAEGAAELLAALADEPKDILGLSSGFPKYDGAIGGGLRPGGITVCGARPKVGKSYLCLNVANNVAAAGIPVLYLDTELPRKYQIMRLASLISGVTVDHIETGQYGKVDEEREAVLECLPYMNKLPFTHCSIAGQSIRNILAIVRRWLAKTVGFLPNGKAKPCLVIYDYLKLMDAGDISKNMAEYQLLGFLLTEMHNFALKYDIPVFATVQLNRSGTDREEGDVIAGSDRILWLCSAFSLLKIKTTEELQQDPATNGDRKLVITSTRYGSGLAPGEYINVQSKLAQGRMQEGPTFSQATAGNSGFPNNSKKKAKKKKDDDGNTGDDD